MKLRFSGMMGKEYTIRHNWDGTGTYFYPHWPTEIAGVASYIASSSDFLPLFSDFNFALADVGHVSLSGKLTHYDQSHHLLRSLSRAFPAGLLGAASGHAGYNIAD